MTITTATGRAIVITLVLLTSSMAWAQDAPASSTSTQTPASSMHDMHGMQASDDSVPGSHQARAKASPPEPDAAMQSMAGKTGKSMQGRGHEDMSGMNMGRMQGGNAPADARDPDYSDGIRFDPGNDVHMMSDARFAMLKANRLEYVNGLHGNSTALEAEGWYGADLNKFWWKLEGEHSNGALADYRAEALWSHAVSAYWDSQFGVRHDGGEGPERNWAAFGVQGLAPYWFDVSATAYVGQGGRTAVRLEADYEILFTQRLILQPKLEVNAYGKNDRQRGIGSGLSDASFGLRLRYEIRRRFAPYIGVEWRHDLGRTADLARRAGGSAADRELVAGIHFWF